MVDFNWNNTGPLTLSRNPQTAADGGLHGWPGRVAAVQITPRSLYGGADFDPAYPLELQEDALLAFDMVAGSGSVLQDVSGNGNQGNIAGANWVGAEGLDCGADSR